MYTFIEDYCHGKNFCAANATCLTVLEVYGRDNNSSSTSCVCNVGYRGSGMISCSDINECEEEFPCHEKATCVNTAGSFTCTCNGSLVGDGINSCDGKTIVLELSLFGQ